MISHKNTCFENLIGHNNISSKCPVRKCPARLGTKSVLLSAAHGLSTSPAAFV